MIYSLTNLNPRGNAADVADKVVDETSSDRQDPAGRNAERRNKALIAEELQSIVREGM